MLFYLRRNDYHNYYLNMNKKRIWLTYDLGISGDYESLFTWLDNHNAVECGNCVATLEYDFTSTPEEDSPAALNVLFQELQKDLSDSVQFNGKSRIYVLTYLKEISLAGGTYIIGSRKPSPWAGYANREAVVDV